jgi:Na+-driven multidrug efflux pump
MQVGGISAVGTLLASLTAVGLTGVVGKAGPDALAGYGIASRIDSLLVPLMFGLGSGVVTMVAAASGAGHERRAAQVIRLSAGNAFAVTTILGLALALAPYAWMTLFTNEAEPLSWGRDYLRVNGPFYGFAGAGLIFYFAAQGRGQMRAAFLAALLRLLITVVGAYAIVMAGFGLGTAFLSVAVGSIVFAIVNGIGLVRTFTH